MPSLAFPVPIYMTATSSPSPLSANQRLATKNSPGTTDSVASTMPMGGLVTTNTYVQPEQAAANNNNIANVGNYFGWGWAAGLQDLGLTANANDGAVVAAGTWTLTIAYKRGGSLLTANPSPVSFTWVLYRMGTGLSGVQEELGRSTVSGITITTTKASSTVSITTTNPSTFLPGEYLYWEIHCDKALQALADASSAIVTNSTTASRLTAAPSYATIKITTGTATGTGTASGVPGQTQGTVGSSAGLGTASGVPVIIQTTVASASGLGTADGVTAQTMAVVGSSSGQSTATAVAAQIGAMVGSSTGSSIVVGSIGQISATIASAAGTSSSNALGSSVVGTVASASGSSTVLGRMAKVIGTVGTATVGGGGGTTTYIRPLFIFDD